MISATSRLRRLFMRSAVRRGADRRHPSGAGATTRMTLAVSIVGVAEAVADTAHREQVLRVLRVGFEFLAKVPYVDVDGAGVSIGRIAPDVLEERLTREHPPGSRRESGEDLELHVGELDRLVIQRHRAPLRVDLEVSG